jgi:uncharacterized peroxidase-related enzyme
MPFVKFLPESAGIGDLLTSDPERYLPVAAFTQALLRGPSPFSVAERELIAAYVSALNECQFCYGAHSRVAIDNGVEAAVFADGAGDPDAMPVSEPMRPVLRYVRKLTLEPSRLVQSDADAVLAAGWSEQALSEIVAIAALFALYNRLVDGHGIRGSEAYFTRLTGFLRQSGYEARTRAALEAKQAGS